MTVSPKCVAILRLDFVSKSKATSNPDLKLSHFQKGTDSTDLQWFADNYGANKNNVHLRPFKFAGEK